MRKLMWFTIGFCAACAAGMYWLWGALLPIIAAFFLAFGIVLLLLRKKKWVRIIGVICLGLAVGLFWCCIYHTVYLRPAKALDGETVSVTIEAVDFSFDSDYGITADGVTEIDDKRYRVRMYLNRKEPLEPGDQVTGNFRMRYTATGGEEEPTHHSGNGILLLAYPRGEHLVHESNSVAVRHMPAYLRQYLLNLIGQLFREDTAPFAKALLLGDTSELDYETESDLSVSGIRHVAAVSGLHVSILFSALYLFSGRRKGLTVALGIPVLLLFAAMAGFSPSILRASLMQFLMLLALLTRREYDPPTALAFAVLVMLSVNPLTVTSAGFQLSVASVSGIFLFSGRISGWLLAPNRFGKWKNKPELWKILAKASASVSISLSAMIMTTPLTAWYFGSVNLLSAVTNLLCLWVVTVIFCGIIAACVFASVWLPLGQILAWFLSWLIRYVLWIAETIAAIPFGAVYTVSPYITAWLVLCGVLLCVFLLSKQKQPLILCCCTVIALCIAMLASWIEPLLDDYRVTVLDVGQGQCILLQSGGKTYMVDCGGSYDEGTADTAAAMLLSQGICQLDGLILTHYDKDHVGAAGYLLHRVGADLVILPEGEEAEVWDPVLLKSHVGNVLRAGDDIYISWDDATITVFSGWTTESSNESSLCVLFQTEKCAILITGDRSAVGEEVLLKTRKLPRLDALVVGHHGASASTGEALLNATRPRTALISVGKDNAYGHPSQKVLDRLAAIGCKIHRTDVEGTIIYRG